MENNKRILVTGGAGFLGSHLCALLLQENHQVICLDNLSTGDKEKIAAFINHPHFHFVTHDIIKPFDCDIDEIYNLACPASPAHYSSDPLHTLHTNTLGINNVLELAHRKKAKIFQASTSEIYGDPDVHPQVETYHGNVNPLGDRACYNEGKRCAEALMMNYHRQLGVRIKMARLFNVYGPNMSPTDGRVVSNFIIQALQNKPLTIHGSGTQTRSFCYVSDMIKAIHLLMNSEESLIGPINLGNPAEINLLELATVIIELTGSQSTLEFKSLPQDDPRRRKPDISLAQQHLNWQPSVDLKTGLIETIAYFDKLLTSSSVS